MGGARAGVFIDNVSFYTGPDPSKAAATQSVKTADGRFTARSVGNGVVFHLPQNAPGTVSIYTLQGMLLRTLPAADRLLWDGKNSRGVQVARGSYIATLTGKNARLAARFMVR
jgi:hypothetical protein